MMLGRILTGGRLAGQDSCKLACEPQKLLEQAFRMDVGRCAKMLEHVDVPIEQLQNKVIDTLQAAAGAGIGRIPCQLLELVVDPADDAIDPAVDGRVSAAGQQGWDEFLIEDD